MSESIKGFTVTGSESGLRKLATEGDAPLPVRAANSYLPGFEGMAIASFSDAALAVLREPVNPDDVEIKSDGIVYLPGVFYRDRLIRAFGSGAWAIAPRSPARRAPSKGGECVMYHGALVILGRYVSEAVGQCVYYPNNAGMQYADAFEGAKTDAITRCCKDLGVARELWDPTWRIQWQAKFAEKGPDGKWTRISRAQKLPNVDTPAQQPAGTVANAAPTAPGVSATAVSDYPVKASRGNDDGEAPTEAELDKLEEVVFRELKWKRQFAGMWLFSHFGTRNPGGLTKLQAASATRLLRHFGTPWYDTQMQTEVESGICAESPSPAGK